MVSLLKAARFLLLVTVAIVMGSGGSMGSPPPDKGPGRVALVLSHAAGPYREALDGFQRHLIEHRPGVEFTAFTLDKGRSGRELEAFLARSDEFDLILVLGTSGTREVLRRLSGVPVVAGLILDPDLVTKSANATGVVLGFPIERQLEWISKILPSRARVGILFNPDENATRIQRARTAAERYGLRLVVAEITSPKEIPTGLKTMSRHADVILGIPDRVVLGPESREAILLFSHREQIPFVGLSAAWVEAGALYALERDFPDLGTQCGELALKLLEGANPKSLKISVPRTVRLAVNAQTSRLMKIEWPDSVKREAIIYPQGTKELP